MIRSDELKAALMMARALIGRPAWPKDVDLLFDDTAPSLTRAALVAAADPDGRYPFVLLDFGQAMFTRNPTDVVKWVAESAWQFSRELGEGAIHLRTAAGDDPAKVTEYASVSAYVMPAYRRIFIYHGNCFDGFTAAWLWDRVLVGSGSTPETRRGWEYVGAKYGEEPPDVTNAEVVIADFSYPRETMLKMAEKAHVITCYDHHKTAQAALEGIPWCHFDMERSGSGLLFDLVSGGERRPWLVDYIEDRDLWRLSLPYSREVAAVVSSLPMTFEAWSELATRYDPRSTFSSLILHEGRAILRYQHQYGTKALAEARQVELGGHTVWAVNLPYMNCSEYVGRLLEERGGPFAAGYFSRADGRWQFSLRAKPDFDVSEVAKRFGGGGHAGAAGFDVEVLPWEDRG